MRKSLVTQVPVVGFKMRPSTCIVVLSSDSALFDQTNRMLPLSSTVVTGGLSDPVVSEDWISVAGVVIVIVDASGVRMVKIGSSPPVSVAERT